MPHRYPQIDSADSVARFRPILSLLRRPPCTESLQSISTADQGARPSKPLFCALPLLVRQILRSAFGVSEERLESLGLRPGIDNLEQILLAVLQRLRGPFHLLFAAPLLHLSLPTLAFDLCLALSLLDEPRDFDRGLLQIPNNGRYTA